VSISLTVISPAETAACCAPLTAQPLSMEQAEQVAPLLKALADPVRLRLLSLVASHEGGEACICDLNDAFGGSLGITDILAEDQLTEAQRLEHGARAGCIAGAPSFAEYRDGLARAGFTGITITPAQQAGDGVHSAIIRAVKP
jgi:hypothetical protein